MVQRSTMPERFVILAVCYANLCRSPLIERLTRLALVRTLGPDAAAFGVSSMGTHARPGMPMHPHAASVLRERGGDGTGFYSRELAPDAVAGADLIITAERGQRALCVSMIPAAATRTFTLREFARLADTVDPASLTEPSAVARARALTAEAHVARAGFQPVAADQDDLADPVGHPLDAFRLCADEIDHHVAVTVGRLTRR